MGRIKWVRGASREERKKNLEAPSFPSAFARTNFPLNVSLRWRLRSVLKSVVHVQSCFVIVPKSVMPCTWRVAVLLIKPTDILTFRLLLSKALYWTPRTRTLLARKRVAIRGIFMNWESNRDVFPISKALNAVLTRINVNIFIVIYQLFLRW